jgi:hypothetical protein
LFPPRCHRTWSVSNPPAPKMASQANLTTATSGNQTLINDPNLCTLQTCDLSLSSLNYIPNLPGNALFLAIFSLLLIIQIRLGIRFRTWGFMTAMSVGLVGRSFTLILPNGNSFRSQFSSSEFRLVISGSNIYGRMITAAQKKEQSLAKTTRK